MKKTLAVIALILIIGTPFLYAAGADQTAFNTAFFSGMGGGALSGASIGALAGGVPGAIVGAIIGGVVGIIGGSAAGSFSQEAEDTRELAQIENDIDTVELNNEKIMKDLESQKLALGNWQNDFDAKIAELTDNTNSNIRQLKEAWGLTNATLSTQNRGGVTAQILSQRKKDDLVKYAGADMSISTDAVQNAIDFYNNESNYDENGHLTAEASNALSDLTAGYGLYEMNLHNKTMEELQKRVPLREQSM